MDQNIPSKMHETELRTSILNNNVQLIETGELMITQKDCKKSYVGSPDGRISQLAQAGKLSLIFPKIA